MRTQAQSNESTTITAEFYAGMLPHPNHLERFEKLQPGATDRLIRMVEGQATHRQAMERKFLNFNGTAQVLGVVIAGLFLLSAVAGGVYLLHDGKTLQGFGAMLAGIVPVAVTFLKQRRDQQSEKDGKEYGKPAGKSVARR
ncbi:MAG: DUF2335 domain-containing protein [Gemmatimonadaceae bacterium]